VDITVTASEQECITITVRRKNTGSGDWRVSEILMHVGLFPAAATDNLKAQPQYVESFTSDMWPNKTQCSADIV